MKPAQLYLMLRNNIYFDLLNLLHYSCPYILYHILSAAVSFTVLHISEILYFCLFWSIVFVLLLSSLFCPSCCPYCGIHYIHQFILSLFTFLSFALCYILLSIYILFLSLLLSLFSLFPPLLFPALLCWRHPILG